MGLLENLPKAVLAAASIPGCDGAQRGRGLCYKHYRRLMEHGDPLFTKYASTENETQIHQRCRAKLRKPRMFDLAVFTQGRSWVYQRGTGKPLRLQISTRLPADRKA
jgi:hypothetical protein